MGVTGLNPVIVSHDLRKTAEPQSLLEGKAVSLDASLIRFAYRYWPKGHPPVPPSPYQTAHALINQILDVQSLQLPPGQTARPPLMLCFEPLVPRHKWENEPRFSDVGTYEDYELAREGKIAAIKQEIVDDGRFKHLTFRHSPGENDETQASLGAQLGHIAISYDSDVLLVSGCVRMVYPKTMTINGVDYPPYGSYVDTQDVLDDVSLSPLPAQLLVPRPVPDSAFLPSVSSQLGVTLGQIQLAALCSRAGFDGHKGLFRFSIADPACLKAVGQFNDQNLDLAAALKTIQEELEIVGMKNEFGTEMQSAFQKAWVYQWERSSVSPLPRLSLFPGGVPPQPDLGTNLGTTPPCPGRVPFPNPFPDLGLRLTPLLSFFTPADVGGVPDLCASRSDGHHRAAAERSV